MPKRKESALNRLFLYMDIHTSNILSKIHLFFFYANFWGVIFKLFLGVKML